MPRILKYQTPGGALPALAPITNTILMAGTMPTSLISTKLAGNYQMGQMSDYDIQRRNDVYKQTFGRSYDSFSKLDQERQNKIVERTVKHQEISASGGLPGQKFVSGDANGIIGAVGGFMNMANNAIFANSVSNKSAEDQSIANVRNSVSDALVKSGNPYAMAAGLAAKLADGVMDATGLRSNQITKKQQEKAGISPVARLVNNFANFFPGNPLALGGKKISDAEMSLDAEQVRGAFAGTVDNIDTAQGIGGNRINFMLSGNTRNNMDDYVKEQNRKNALLTDISRTNTLRKQNNYAQELNKQNENRYNGNTYQSMAIGKEGLKLPDREMLDALYAKKVTSFKEGGVIGVDSNVIPEGALHKELNHMEEHNKELDKVITDKGIAVVTTDKEGNIEQVAEIEKEEIVFRLELTKKIEELWHEGTPEAMLKAGKILVKEIMGNTDDNTEEILDGDN